MTIDHPFKGTKCIYRNKLDESGVISRNEGRVVVRSFNHELGIEYDETVAFVTILEAIKMPLTFSCYKNFR